jgi:hypothetical protein
MFEPTSRYAAVETAALTLPDGRTVAYKRRRFLPRGEEMPLQAEVLVAQGERLDLITARALGDSLHFWRICDANDATDPFDLVAEPGRVLRVPVPQP